MKTILLSLAFLIISNLTTAQEFWITTADAPEPFPCGELLTDERDGKQYETVLIGTQCWMAENLNIGTMMATLQNNQTNNGTIEKYCHDNIASNCDEYGGLYQWGEAMEYSSEIGSQGICPEGWHIPSLVEFENLKTYLGGAPIAGGKLKESGYTHWDSPNAGADNSSGFTGLGGGYCEVNLGFPYLKQKGFWFSSNGANGLFLSYDSFSASQAGTGPTTGASLRCLNN